MVAKPFDLTGQAALVAGAAGYFGMPICMGLAGQGAHVALADVDEPRMGLVLEDLLERRFRGRALALPLEVTEEESIRAAIRRVGEEFGRLHILINCTYLSTARRVEEVTSEEFDRALHANITSAFLLAREAAALMKGAAPWSSSRRCTAGSPLTLAWIPLP